MATGVDARLGLAKEMLEVILGLEPKTLERVMRTIRGSEDASDVKTNIIRSRIGSRSMKYLRNAIDIARKEGVETHKASTTDDTKNVDLEPGAKRTVKTKPKKEKEKIKENFSFKSFLTELNLDVDLSEPTSAIQKIKKAARMGPDRAALQNIRDTRDDVKAARDADPESPTKQLDIKISNLTSQLAQLQKRRASLTKNQENQAEMQ